MKVFGSLFSKREKIHAFPIPLLTYILFYGKIGHMKKEYIECGKILGAHGVRGVCKVEVWCDSPKVLVMQKHIFLARGEGNYEEHKLLGASVANSDTVLLTIEGIDSREMAQGMKNTVLYLRRGDIPMKKGAFLLVDLIDLPVIDIDTGRVYGKISAVDEVPTGLLITIATDDGDVLMPYVDAFFKKVDIEDAVYISPIPGFFKEEV